MGTDLLALSLHIDIQHDAPEMLSLQKTGKTGTGVDGCGYRLLTPHFSLCVQSFATSCPETVAVAITCQYHWRSPTGNYIRPNV
jgi:hypothetical protein